MIIGLCIGAILLSYFTFEMGRASGESFATERIRQLERANEALRRSVNFVEAENENLQRKLGAHIVGVIPENLNITSLYGDGEISLIQKNTERFTAAIRSKLDEEFWGY